MLSETFVLLLPHILLALAASLFLLAGTFRVSPRVFAPVALLVLGVVAGCLWNGSTETAAASTGLSVQSSPLAVGFQLCCLAAAALFVLQSMSARAEAESTAEFYGLLLLVFDGLMLVSVANDLIVLFLSLELISIPTYVLLYLGRRDQRSQEAALKYFLLSIFSAALLLYGLAFVYGLTGSTQLGAVRTVLTESYQPTSPGQAVAAPSALGIVALVLIFAGIGFKVAAVPFHFYAPDVYEGTSAFNAGLLAVVPKAAGFLALFRLAGGATAGFEGTGQQLALILAGVTMTGGNCLALLQTNVRRMLAYSSVAHAGYMLIGFAVGFWEQGNAELALTARGGMGLPGGMQSSLLYLLAYSLTSIGLFAALIYLGRPGRQIEHVDDLTGLAKSQPVVAVAVALFLFSLAGIPPLPGFWGKFAVFASALSVRQPSSQIIFQLHPAFAVLAVVGVLNAAIGAVYYLRLIALMFLQDPLGASRPAGGRSAYAAMNLAALGVVLLGLIPGPVFQFLQNAPVAAVAAAAVPPAEPAEVSISSRQDPRAE